MLFSLLPVVIVNGQRRQSVTHSQKEQARATAQMDRLREDYIKATKDYKASLEKLTLSYEASKKTAEARLQQSKELFKLGLGSKRDLEASERAVSDAQSKIDYVCKEVDKANAKIAQMPTTAELVREQIAWQRTHKRARQPACPNWTLTASRHQRGRTVTVAFTLVCKY